ncbi:MAG: hypothetical protein MK100_00605 [Phycisphaerales bacterium]|nr:hypothetical protein [Phycisphaerales bacterium]
MTCNFNADTPSPSDATFSFASLFAPQTLTVNRTGQRIEGELRGISISHIILGLEALPSASWVTNGIKPDSTTPPWACRVIGPVEPGDRLAIGTAIERQDDPLDFELRADLLLRSQSGSVRYICRSHETLLDIAGLLLQQHAAQALSSAVANVPLPEAGVVDAVLGDKGLSLRSIETDVFPSFLDIGIADAVQEAAPATRSVIFDRVTSAWHTG